MDPGADQSPERRCCGNTGGDFVPGNLLYKIRVKTYSAHSVVGKYPVLRWKFSAAGSFDLYREIADQPHSNYKLWTVDSLWGSCLRDNRWADSGCI